MKKLLLLFAFANSYWAFGQLTYSYDADYYRTRYSDHSTNVYEWTLGTGYGSFSFVSQSGSYTLPLDWDFTLTYHYDYDDAFNPLGDKYPGRSDTSLIYSYLYDHGGNEWWGVANGRIFFQGRYINWDYEVTIRDWNSGNNYVGTKTSDNLKVQLPIERMPDSDCRSGNDYCIECSIVTGGIAYDGNTDTPDGQIILKNFFPNDLEIFRTDNTTSKDVKAGEQISLVAKTPNANTTDTFPNFVYNWQYSVDGGNSWYDIPDNYKLANGNQINRNNNNTHFSIQDILGNCHTDFLGQPIDFRLGYGNRAFTSTFRLNYIADAPVITNVIYQASKCLGDGLQKLEVTFDRPLDASKGEILATISISDINNIDKSFMDDENVSYPAHTKTYTFDVPFNLEAGQTYNISYQAITYPNDPLKTKMGGLLSSPCKFDFQYNEPLPAITVNGDPNIKNATGFNIKDGSINIAFNGTAPYTYTWTKDPNNPSNNTPPTLPTPLTPEPDSDKLGAGYYTITANSGGCSSEPYPFTITQPLELIGSISGNTMISCYNGTTTLTASAVGGYLSENENYSYSWAITYLDKSMETKTGNVVTGKAGQYVLTVSDKASPANSTSTSVTIDQKPLLKSSENITPIKCNGDSTGAVTLTLEGGSGSYNVTWQNNSSTSQTRTNLSKGIYNYTITDTNATGCSISGSATVSEPSNGLTITSASQTPPTSINAIDGKLTLDVSGGTGSYTYFLKKGNENEVSYTSNQITGLKGIYTLRVEDTNGCSYAYPNSIVIEPLTVSETLSSHVNVLCKGEPTSTGSLAVVVSGGKLSNNENYAYQWYESTTANGTFTIKTGNTNQAITGLSAGFYKVKIGDSATLLSNTPGIWSNTFEITQPTNELSVTSTPEQQHNPTCYNKQDGSIAITVVGGTGGYTYDWSNSETTQDISGLIAGTYSVTVTDKNSCIKTISGIEITQSSTITIPQESITPVLINGQSTGAITFPNDPIGGSGGYTYNWTSSTDVSFPKTSKDISGLKAGKYLLEVIDSKSCSITKEYEIIENPLLTVNIKESSPIKCTGDFNGELTAEVQGGVSPYKYEWAKDGVILSEEKTKTISNLGLGKYSVYVTDSVNTAPTGPFAQAEELNHPLSPPPILIVSLTKKTNVLCHGEQTGAIGIQIEGGTLPYTAIWSNENTSLPARTNLGKLDIIPSLFSGIYNVIITDAHNCATTLPASITITQPTDPLLITDLEIKNLTGFESLNGSISAAITGGTAPYSYAWKNKGVNTIIGDKAQIGSLPMGTYELTITDDHNCTVTKDYFLKQPDKLLITAITQTPTSTIKCNGDKFGILEAAVTGGAPIGMLDADKNYTYKWYNILTPNVTASTTNPSETLVAGTYVLTVTDIENNTFTLQSAPIIEPPLLRINYTQTNVSCYDGNNGSISITVTGGTGNHTISWSNGKDTETINNLRAGIYTVTVTDENQCQTIKDITITEPDLLYVSKVTKNPPSVLGQQDGSIQIEVSGGTPNYNYLWYNGSKDLIYSDLNQPSNTSINNIFAGQYFISITDAKGCAIIEKDLDKIDPLVLSVNQINVVRCNGNATASIKAGASGGTPIYYYKWYKTTDPLNAIGQDATLVNANAGTYYVVLSDSFGLTKQSENITITEPDILSNTLSSEYTRCGDANDWSITTTPTGGTAPYTYIWNTAAKTASLNDVSPGSYSALVTDTHGCTITKNITITAPIHLATAETITKPTCFEGSDATIVLNSSGGQGPYSYLWNTNETSNILSNASAKEYTVAVTDFKGCVINKIYTIENPPKDVINLGEDVTLCFDQSITINSTIADDKAKYSWTSTKGFISNNPIITVSEPADYTLVVTNKIGCKATDLIKISSQNTAVSAEFAVSSQVFLNEKFIIVDISNPIADGIEWILPAEATVVSKNKDFAELSFSKAGEYELTLNTKKGNCTASQTKKIVVTQGEYVDPESTDLTKKFDLKIYPNPSNGIFSVDVTLDKVMPAHVKVYNLNNNLIIDSKYEEGKDAYIFNFSLSGLIPGVYFVLVESQQGNQLRKIIIN